jgi:hypothetical protein
MASFVSSGPHFSPGTVTTRLCIRAMGRELLLLNIAAAMQKFRWDFLSRKSVPRVQATTADTEVTPTKKRGMIQSSLSFSGDREKATLEKRRQGVKSDTFNLFRCFCVFLSRMPLRDMILKKDLRDALQNLSRIICPYHPMRHMMKTSKIACNLKIDDKRVIG